MARSKLVCGSYLSGYENKVKANIEKTIENRHLEDQILEVRVPMQDVVEVKNATQKQVSKKLFPGYVLINMVMNDDTWYVVRNTRGVTGFVGPGSTGAVNRRRNRSAGHSAGSHRNRLCRRRQRSCYRRCMERYYWNDSEYQQAEAACNNQC